jgi:hypothetical protein
MNDTIFNIIMFIITGLTGLITTNIFKQIDIKSGKKYDNLTSIIAPFIMLLLICFLYYYINKFVKKIKLEFNLTFNK